MASKGHSKPSRDLEILFEYFLSTSNALPVLLKKAQKPLDESPKDHNILYKQLVIMVLNATSKQTEIYVGKSLTCASFALCSLTTHELRNRNTLLVS